jgi:hypothetical protein
VNLIVLLPYTLFAVVFLSHLVLAASGSAVLRRPGIFSGGSIRKSFAGRHRGGGERHELEPRMIEKDRRHR